MEPGVKPMLDQSSAQLGFNLEYGRPDVQLPVEFELEEKAKESLFYRNVLHPTGSQISTKFR